MSGKSRRQAIAKSGSSQAIGFNQRSTDEAAEACSEWLNRHEEHERLIRQWQRLETHLIREHDLFNLNRRDRASLPGASELDAINARIIALFTQNQKLLATIPSLVATTIDGVASKLSVALASVPPDESRATHKLVKSILRDLQAVAQNFGE
ncbi:hypothetical protein [Hyphomonas chukchiensis]|uniref:Uncharacterized protein n=1 Tax=Hyphomonas chukchiensis TaxID=1280947 RepID=A0A062UTH1_9PROT|nr:hypothetical protein [Hyphomonas chukchiensis]KCZ61102.1 hypothetical protein HY30_01815 [Hyphomonas chukchiensis]